MAEKIESYFEDGKKWGISIKYSYEKTPLAAGALKKISSLLDADFLMVNGDNYADIDYRELFEYHKQKNALVTLSLKKIENKNVCHTLSIEKGRILEYYGSNEKNKGNAAFRGVFAINKKILTDIKRNRVVFIERDLINKYIKERGAFGLFQDGYFADIGTPEGYLGFIEDLKNNKI